MERIIKFGDIEIQKQKFHQHKRPISIKNIDINKIVVFTSYYCFIIYIFKVSFWVKKDLNTPLATKMLKKLDL